MKILFVALWTALFIGDMARAQTLDSYSSLEGKLETYVRESGLEERARRGEVVVVRAIEAVQVPSTHREWARYRTIAMEQALSKAQSDFLTSQYSRNQTEAITRVFRAAQQEPPPYDSGTLGSPTKFAELMRKLMALQGAWLDATLRELGVDPKDLEKAAPAQRHIQISRLISTTSMRKSFGALVGLVPDQLFEADDGKGNYLIGLVAVWSPKLRDFAKEMQERRGGFAPDSSKATKLRESIQDKNKLMFEFGVRRTYDEDGLPVLLSFYQWAPELYANDPASMANARELATQQAILNADRQIIEFLNATAVLADETVIKAEMEKAVDRMANGDAADKSPEHSIQEAIKNTFKRTASGSIRGLHTMTTWGQNHPGTGTLIVGVVRAWSAAQEHQIRQRPSTPIADAPKTMPPPPAAPGVRQGAGGRNQDF